MRAQLQPWQLLLVILDGWVNCQQQDAIGYLRTENRILRERLGNKRILLNDDQPRRLAVKGKILGRKMLEELAGIVTPETIPRWHRQLVARQWDYSGRSKAGGRPSVTEEIVELILRMAKESPTWSYERIQGALATLGYRCASPKPNLSRIPGFRVLRRGCSPGLSEPLRRGARDHACLQYRGIDTDLIVWPHRGEGEPSLHAASCQSYR